MNPSLLPLLLAANKYRLINYDFPQILPDSLQISTSTLIVLALIAISITAGIMFAKAVRMRDYGWKVSLILSTILVSTFVVLFGDYKLGVDLKGGVILVYEVNELETAQLRRGAREVSWDMGQLIAVITRRLNPTGLKEIVVRPFGNKQVEIVVPEVDPQEIENIKEKIRTGGVLQFMIVASDERDSDRELAEAARKQSLDKAHALDRAVIDPETRTEVTGKEGSERQVGYWARLVREKAENSPYRSSDVVVHGYLRDARTGEILELTPQEKQAFASPDPSFFDAYLKQRGTPAVDVLMVFDSDFAIRGDDLSPGLTYAGHDEAFRPAIH